MSDTEEVRIDDRPGHHRLIRVGIIVMLAIVCIFGIAAYVLYTSSRPHDQYQAALRQTAKSVSFPLYYPADLPSYFFIDLGSVHVSSNLVIFTVSRDDGQKVFVTESALPQGYDLGSISGTHVKLPIGTAVVGSGFVGYRAVITTPKTLIITTSSTAIGQGDFALIVKSFKPVAFNL